LHCNLYLLSFLKFHFKESSQLKVTKMYLLASPCLSLCLSICLFQVHALTGKSHVILRSHFIVTVHCLRCLVLRYLFLKIIFGVHVLFMISMAVLLKQISELWSDKIVISFFMTSNIYWGFNKIILLTLNKSKHMWINSLLQLCFVWIILWCLFQENCMQCDQDSRICI
jgi:hypothetical protein